MAVDYTGQTNDNSCCGTPSCCCGCNSETWTPGVISQDIREELFSNSFQIDPGAYFVDVRNVGIYPIWVNGEKVSPMTGEWHSEQQLDYVREIQDFVGAINIDNPQGSEFWVKRAFPSPGNANNCGFSTGVMVEKRLEKTTDIIVPAGAYFVDIRNVGATEILVNGEKVSPMTGEWHSKNQINTVQKIQDFVPEINIQLPNGGEYWIKVAYPSGSSGLINSIV